MTDREIIDGLREKSKLMYGVLHQLLIDAANRLEQLTTQDTVIDVTTRAGQPEYLIVPTIEAEPLDRWEER